MISIKINDYLAVEHYIKIKPILVHNISRVIDNNGIFKYPKNQPSVHCVLTPQLRKFLIILRDNDTVLKNLISLNPLKLNKYANWIIDKRNTYTINTTFDYKILYNIFVDHAYEKLDKFNHTDKIGFDTCPYCNRNYTYSINRNKKLKPEIDHFYPKSKFPLFAVSYYNLIPSCQQCNGLGGKKELNPIDIGLISPYLIESKDFKFSYKIKNISIINPFCGNSDIEVYFKSKIQIHCNTFNLEDFYSKHNDHALELIIKKKIKYSDKYRKYLNSYKGLQFNKAEIDRMILGNYSLEKEQHKRPLSKLYQDIGIELGLIKK